MAAAAAAEAEAEAREAARAPNNLEAGRAIGESCLLEIVTIRVPTLGAGSTAASATLEAHAGLG